MVSLEDLQAVTLRTQMALEELLTGVQGLGFTSQPNIEIHMGQSSADTGQVLANQLIRTPCEL